MQRIDREKRKLERDAVSLRAQGRLAVQLCACEAATRPSMSLLTEAISARSNVNTDATLLFVDFICCGVCVFLLKLAADA